MTASSDQYVCCSWFCLAPFNDQYICIDLDVILAPFSISMCLFILILFWHNFLINICVLIVILFWLLFDPIYMWPCFVMASLWLVYMCDSYFCHGSFLIQHVDKIRGPIWRYICIRMCVRVCVCGLVSAMTLFWSMYMLSCFCYGSRQTTCMWSLFLLWWF